MIGPTNAGPGATRLTTGAPKSPMFPTLAMTDPHSPTIRASHSPLPVQTYSMQPYSVTGPFAQGRQRPS
jgi:hypothetical protein